MLSSLGFLKWSIEQEQFFLQEKMTLKSVSFYADVEKFESTPLIACD
jgi:hypothetical protein